MIQNEGQRHLLGRGNKAITCAQVIVFGVLPGKVPVAFWAAVRLVSRVGPKVAGEMVLLSEGEGAAGKGAFELLWLFCAVCWWVELEGFVFGFWAFLFLFQ